MGEGERGMNGESNMETYTAICKADSPWEFAVGLRELKPGLCDHLEEWSGRWEGGSRGREHTEKKKRQNVCSVKSGVEWWRLVELLGIESLPI